MGLDSTAQAAQAAQPGTSGGCAVLDVILQRQCNCSPNVKKYIIRSPYSALSTLAVSAMTRSHTITAVLQTVTLSACALVVSHHLFSHAIHNASSSELWQNITAAFEGAANASAQAGFNDTASSGIVSNGTMFNGTAANNTTNGISSTDNESFYLRTLPRELFLLIALSPLYYHWHLWLERFLPGRPRVAALTPAGGKPGFGEGDNQEEEIVQRWIAQGKVRRASLSWWNTFSKWVLNLTFGTMWMESLRFFLAETIMGKSPIKVLKMMWGLVSID